MAYYLSTLVVIFATYVILGLGLNLQYGLTGVLNFGYYLFFAIGAYVGGITIMGGDHSATAKQLGEVYAWNLPVHLPYPLSVLCAVAVTMMFSVVVGCLLLRSVREDFGALITFIVFLGMYIVIGAYTPLFDGYLGIAGVPSPVPSLDVWYTVIAVGWMAIACVLVWRISRSPYGRVLRAIRERPEAAAALGKRVNRYRLSVFILGNGLAALSGAVLVSFIGSWSPLSWQEAETLVVFSIVIVGGRGNNAGVVLGAAVVGVGINEAVLFVPSISGDPSLIPSLQWVLIGIITIMFLWVRPRGLMPERKPGWAEVEGSREGNEALKAAAARVRQWGVGQ